MVDRSEHGIHRRVTGSHDLRLDGATDLLHRCTGWSVFDVGCNRGMIGYEFAINGATVVHGCDMYETGIIVAREVFADMRQVKHRFEVVDLNGGIPAIKAAFGDAFGTYDLVIMSGIYHKLERSMTPPDLEALFVDLSSRAKRYTLFRSNYDHQAKFEAIMAKAGPFELIQWSDISEIGMASIYRRK